MIFNGKEIYIWGARWRGKQICDFLKDKHSLSIKAFIDSDTKLIGSSYCGVEVIAPKYFFDKYNSVDTIIIIACFNAVYEEEIVEEIGKNHFRGETVLQGDFHSECELPFFLSNSVIKYEIDFEKRMDKWIDNIVSEMSFWDYEVSNPQGVYWNHYLNRVAPKEFVCPRAKDKVGIDSIVLDVGCGVCTQYGNILNGKVIDLRGVDPLAFFYNMLNARYMRTYNKPFEVPHVDFGMFELLSYKYGENYCDIILIDNALDHCIDPLISIVECLRTLKIGGTLSTFHHVDEAYKAGYSELHQWNLCIGKKGHFIIWNTDNYVDVTEILKEYVKIDTSKTDNRTTEIPFGGVICNMTKIKDIPQDFMCIDKRKVGFVIERMMSQLSNVDYAMKLIQERCRN